MATRRLATFRVVAVLLAIVLLIHYTRQSEPHPPRDASLPPPTEIAVPRTVHQLFIASPRYPLSKFKPNSHTISWMQSGWKLEHWGEDSCLQLAQELDSTNAFAKTFQLLPTGVLRSDFCRYLIMYGRGGIYNDLDVHLMKPLPWIAMGPSGKPGEGPPKLIIGLEGDAATKGLPRSPQFVQWTIVSTPSHPVLKDVLDRIVERTPSFAKSHAVNKDAEIDTMNWTGPSVWTDAVLAYLDSSEKQLENIKNLKEPLRVKDTLLLPKRSFAIIQGQDHSLPDIYVKHYFAGTWKTCQQSWMPWKC
ncbi:alpha-1,6-mannosyltransferase subunit [Xylogone sp. PMI_703]|nr:alpha-1,6-mannosyltransferase subunit [Xylogone sp. PMI_703]